MERITLADPVSPPAARSPALGWALIVFGLAVCALTTWFAPDFVTSFGLSSDMATLLLFYAAIFLPMIIVSLVFARIEGLRLLRAGTSPGRWALLGGIGGLAGLGVTAGYAILSRSAAPGTAEHAGAAMLALGSAVILFQTASEEILFRGWLQESLSGKVGAVAAIGLSALAFSAFHMLGGSKAPLSLVNLLLGGLWFGLLAWRSGGLIAPVAAHFAWNASEELALGLTPNPGTGSFGALFDWDLVQGPLWGGAEEGLNSGVGMTIVLIALILPLVWRTSITFGPAVTAPVLPAPHQPGRAAV